MSVYGFEWVKDINLQRQYNHEKATENPYTPIPQGTIIGFEWNKNLNRQLRYRQEEISPNPYRPVRQKDIIGFEWRKDTNEQLQYMKEDPETEKYLFEDNGKIKKWVSGEVQQTLKKDESFTEEGTLLRAPLNKEIWRLIERLEVE